MYASMMTSTDGPKWLLKVTLDEMFHLKHKIMEDNFPISGQIWQIMRTGKCTSCVGLVFKT